MPDTARPYPVYPTAHLGDKELNRCTWAAEGLLWRLMSLSATGHIFGYVTDSKGTGLTATEIMENKAPAVIRGKCSLEETQRLLKELLDEHRIERDRRCNAFYIPKMIRIGHQRQNSSNYGRRGGNPVLTRAKEQATANQLRDRAVQELVESLWRLKDNDDEFKRCLSAGRDKYKDYGNHEGLTVMDEALEIIKWRKSKNWGVQK